MKLEKFAPCLQVPFPGWKSLISLRLLMVLPFLKPWKSLHAELAGYFKDPRLQLAFTFQSKYLGMSPFQCPSLFSILSFLEYEHGIWHPTGGCNSISTNMARAAQEVGVEIHLNTGRGQDHEKQIASGFLRAGAYSRFGPGVSRPVAVARRCGVDESPR